MNAETVIVSGVGFILPNGEKWSELITISPDMLETSAWPEATEPPSTESKISKISKINTKKYLSAAESKISSRFVVMALNCAGDTLKDAGYLGVDDPLVYDDIGCIVGTSRPEFGTYGKFMEPILQEKHNKVNPMLFPLLSRSAAVGQICIRFNLKGYCPTIGFSQISGAHAVARSMDVISTRRAGRMLVGGVETLSASSLKHNHVFYKDFYSDDSGFDKDKLIPSEGACFLMLESQKTLVDNNVDVLATLSPYRLGKIAASTNVVQKVETLQHFINDLLDANELSWTDVAMVSTSIMTQEVNSDQVIASTIEQLNMKCDYSPLISSPKTIFAESEGCGSALIIANAVQYVLGRGCIGHSDSSAIPQPGTSSLVIIVDENNNYYLQLVSSISSQS